MKLKNIINKKELILINISLGIVIFLLYYFNVQKAALNYIMFDTVSICFRDLLTVLLTIYVALFGLVVTVCSVLVALGGNPFLKALRSFNQSVHFINKIKISLFCSSSIIIFLSVIYCGFDFSIVYIRLFLVYFIILLSFIFYKHFKEIIKILLNILYREISIEKSK